MLKNDRKLHTKLYLFKLKTSCKREKLHTPDTISKGTKHQNRYKFAQMRHIYPIQSVAASICYPLSLNA